MNDIGYTIIGAAIFVLFMLFARRIVSLSDSWWNKQAHYQRRKEYYRQQLARQRNRFLFDMKINKTIPQAVKESKQAVKYKGYFKDFIILRVWYTDRPRECYYITSPNESDQIKKFIENCLDKPNVDIITINRLSDKTKSKE